MWRHFSLWGCLAVTLGIWWTCRPKLRQKWQGSESRGTEGEERRRKALAKSLTLAISLLSDTNQRLFQTTILTLSWVFTCCSMQESKILKTNVFLTKLCPPLCDIAKVINYLKFYHLMIIILLLSWSKVELILIYSHKQTDRLHNFSATYLWFPAKGT